MSQFKQEKLAGFKQMLIFLGVTGKMGTCMLNTKCRFTRHFTCRSWSSTSTLWSPSRLSVIQELKMSQENIEKLRAGSIHQVTAPIGMHCAYRENLIGSRSGSGHGWVAYILRPTNKVACFDYRHTPSRKNTTINDQPLLLRECHTFRGTSFDEEYEIL